MSMQVEIAGEEHLLQPGRVFTMGRTGDLIIDETPYLHRDFLTLHHSEGFWWLTNVGSRDSVLLTDPGNVSRSELGPGGTLPLLIPHIVVRFAAGPHSYELNLTLESAPVEIVVAPRVTEVSGAGMSGASFTESQLLAMLAVAEPLLKRVGTGVWAVPTAAQAARRLGWTQTRFNRKLDNVCDKLDRAGVSGLRGGPGNNATNRRVQLVEYAVSTLLVTSADLPMLEAEARANREQKGGRP